LMGSAVVVHLLFLKTEDCNGAAIIAVAK